jgi:hypothetical protein
MAKSKAVKPKSSSTPPGDQEDESGLSKSASEAPGKRLTNDQLMAGIMVGVTLAAQTSSDRVTVERLRKLWPLLVEAKRRLVPQPGMYDHG